MAGDADEIGDDDGLAHERIVTSGDRLLG
jgi:hypothetical protein